MDNQPKTRADFQKEMDRFMEGFGKFTDGYEEANPEWMGITLLQIFYHALEDLKRLLDNPEETAVTWDSPIVELDYPVKADWKEEKPYYYDLHAKDLENRETEKKKLLEAFITVRDMFILRRLTRDILVIYKKDKWGYKLPLAIDKKLAKLSKAERLKRIDKLLKHGTRPKRFPIYDIPSGKKRAKAFVIFQINPCVLDVDKKLAYYPIIIGLEFKGLTPKDMPPDFRARLWEGMLKGAKAAIPEETFDFLRAVPTARPVSSPGPLVRASLDTERLKFGHRTPGPLFAGLLDETKKEITQKSIDVIGFDFSPAQNRALFAIQKMLTGTGYKGNREETKIENEAWGFSGMLPALEFSPAQYLEAYGAAKFKTARGKEEYSPRERAEALAALISLTAPFLIVLKKRYIDADGVEVNNRIEKIAPLLEIIRGWEALTRKEDASLDKGKGTPETDQKLRAIAIRPAPIIVKDIDRRFILKPADHYQIIRMKFPGCSKFVYTFIDWLFEQAEQKRRARAPLVIRENYLEIAIHLRMKAIIESNQLKRIRGTLNKCYQIAKGLGFLLSYETAVPGKTKELDLLELNPEKFGRALYGGEEGPRPGQEAEAPQEAPGEAQAEPPKT